jgi:hypothetical protein
MSSQYLEFLANLTLTQRDAILALVGDNPSIAVANGDLYFRLPQGAWKKVLLDGDVVGTAPASETVTGTVQLATQSEFDAGVDADSGSPLVAKPSQIKAALDTKVVLNGDIGGTITVPQVQSSTTPNGFLVRNGASSNQARLKATGAAELSVRNAADDGYATLKTGAADVNGNLNVTGNMTVQGTLTSVNSTDTEIKDNVVTLNKGETGAGVSLGTAGFEVDRGTEPSARFIFDEADDQFKAGIGTQLKTLVQKATVLLPNTPLTQHVVTHGLKTLDVLVTIYEGNKEEHYDVQTSTINTITINSAAPIQGKRVVIVG